MNPLNPTSITIWPVFIQGLALSFGLIVAIGAQNAFVLRQGLRREHVGSVVLFCATADAVLIMAGVFGMAKALGDRPDWARTLAWAGALFLAWYGWKALMRMRRPDRLQASSGEEGLKKSAAVAQAARLLRHRAAGGQHGLAATCAFAGVVCGWGGCGQRHLVQFAGLWGAVAGALVCPRQSVAGA